MNLRFKFLLSFILLPAFSLILIYHIIFSIKLNYIENSLITALFFIGLPLVYYLFKGKESDVTFWIIFYCLFKITPYFFSMENNFFELIFRWKIYLNSILLILLISKLVVFIKALKIKPKGSIDDDYSIISKVLQDFIKFKKIGKIISFEVCSFYYCFFKWKKVEVLENQYSGYKNSGVKVFYIALMGVSVVEAVGIHLLVMGWSKVVAYVFFTAHVYILINLTGHLKAMIFRQSLVLNEKVLLRYGLFDTLEIPINLINSIDIFESDYEKSIWLVKLALLGKLEPHNICIELKQELTVNLPFGIRKEPKKILLYIDESGEFIRLIREKMLS